MSVKRSRGAFTIIETLMVMMILGRLDATGSTFRWEVIR